MICASPALKRRIADSRDRLYRVAFSWCGDEMLADDLVQEAIETGIRKRRQLRDESKLFPWLYRILNNAWYAHLRKDRTHEMLDDDMPTEDIGPCNICQELELVTRVRAAVASLPRDQRQVVSLVDLGGLPYCEVAETLEIPIGTVMSRLHRARKGLLASMDGAPAELMTTRGNIRLVE
ncbi:MAG: RNA polymerase sigma factor [Pseudomonadota bacterium]